ncbi:hypothetical protein [uncultured Amnibacterium sp.]|uniref:hypothetical protein n=1 Tax=uncultured Amnibacterium sp. TaxID=1631851 RepID=UPI0035C94831
MRSSSKLLAGLTDSGSAAGATFFAGIIAVRELGTAPLALYALLFSSSVLAMVLPRQLHYIPAQLGANLERGRAAPHIAADGRRAIGADLLTVVIVLASGLPVLGQVEPPVFLALALTAAGFAVVSPLQDHVRSSLHLVDRHWSAAVCSAIVLVTAAAAAGTLLLTSAGAVAPLIPFGSLLVANAVSVVVGLVLLRGSETHARYVPQPLRIRSRFLFAEVTVQAAWFGCNSAVLVLVSAKALGDLEAARVLASPLNIVTTGLLTFLGPALLRSVAAKDAAAVRRGVLRVLLAILGAGLVYSVALAVLAGPVHVLLDRPVDVALVGARLVSVVLEGFSGVLLYLVFGMGRSAASLGASVTAGLIGFVGTVLLIPVLREFALPAGQSLGMAVRVGLGLRVLRPTMTGHARHAS